MLPTNISIGNNCNYQSKYGSAYLGKRNSIQYRDEYMTKQKKKSKIPSLVAKGLAALGATVLLVKNRGKIAKLGSTLYDKGKNLVTKAISFIPKKIK